MQTFQLTSKFWLLSPPGENERVTITPVHTDRKTHREMQMEIIKYLSP
jgi:hypothetical protein